MQLPTRSESACVNPGDGQWEVRAMGGKAAPTAHSTTKEPMVL